MTDLRQAAQQALEALEEYVNVVVSVNDPNEWTPKVADAGEPARKAITALREALVRQTRKPMVRDEEIERLNEKIEFLSRTNMLYSDWEHRETQVTSDLIRKGIEEGKINAQLRAEIERLKQREWQGLTDEEVQFYRKKHSKLFNAGYDKVTETNLIAEEFNSIGFYKEVSTVLKERNT